MRGSMTEKDTSQRTSAAGPSPAEPALTFTASPILSDEAAQLLSDADGLLRLGLVGQAIKHLASAVRRDPSLRVLREPLVKLYLSQHQYGDAIAELWALARTSHNASGEIRYLRYILHLDGTQREAARRIEKLEGRHSSDSLAQSDDGRQPVRVARQHGQAGLAESESARAKPSAHSRARVDAASILKKGTILRSFGQLQPASLLFQTILQDEICGARATLLLGQCQRELGRIDDAIQTFLSGINRSTASEADLSELFYELGRSYERLANVEIATLYYNLAIGSAVGFRDAHDRIATLRTRQRKTPKTPTI